MKYRFFTLTLLLLLSSTYGYSQYIISTSGTYNQSDLPNNGLVVVEEGVIATFNSWNEYYPIVSFDIRGSLIINGGTVRNNSTLTIAESGEMNINGGSLNLQGTVDINGSVTSTGDISLTTSGGTSLILGNTGLVQATNVTLSNEADIYGEINASGDFSLGNSGAADLFLASDGIIQAANISISQNADIYGTLKAGSPCSDCDSCTDGMLFLSNSGSSNIHSYAGSYIEANNAEFGEGVQLEGKIKIHCDLKITNSGSAELILIGGELEVGRELKLEGVSDCSSDAAISDKLDVSGGGSIKVGETNPTCLESWLDDKGVLPVELIFFSAKKQTNSILLIWATASEENNDYFEIQRSTDGVNFEIIGSVEGYGNSQARIDYEFTDFTVPNGNIYYRLKQVDYNGLFEYYPLIVRSDAAGDLSILNLSGNPLTGNTLKLQVYSPIDQPIWFKLIGQNGVVYYLEEKKVFSGNTLLTIDIEHVNPAMIILQATTGQYSKLLKLIKQ
ncbi:hypothetical protein V6R21_24245 [Limibacter armeniacum]|uniref:hypothetical protein n=1 Tax=Limibacter armeniacum TaxID=466084 RepID=UPI002FE62872